MDMNAIRHNLKENDKVVEMPIEDFNNLVQEIQVLKDENSELRKANKFLNDEIDDFNKMK